MSLRRMSAKRRAALESAGTYNPFSTIARAAKTAVAKVRRRRDTGPDRSARAKVVLRSGGHCEWPGCLNEATDIHHRLNRKMGGRRGADAERVNGVAWLLHCCRLHHTFVTSPHGMRMVQAKSMGWVLVESQDAAKRPVLTRHDTRPVLLLDNGGFLWQTSEGWAQG